MSVGGSEHWMALEGGADGLAGRGVVHEPVRGDRCVSSGAAVEY